MSRAIDSENLYKFLTDQCVKETGAFAKGVNKGLNIARSALRNEQIAPTLTPTTIGHCKDCDNWNEQFSAGRKSLNNYVCYCSEWSDPEIRYERYTLPNDYCSYFEPKEGMEDGKND